MLPLRHLSEMVLSAVSHTPLARLLILLTTSSSSTYVLFDRSELPPTHIIQGTADRTVPYKYASEIQDLVPQAELVTIMNGGHDITVTHAKGVNAALLRFLSGGLSFDA